MGFKVVNPFSKACQPFITLNGQICNLLVPPSPVIEQKLGPLVVQTECIYTCNNPARAHTITHLRVLGFLEWFWDSDED